VPQFATANKGHRRQGMNAVVLHTEEPIWESREMRTLETEFQDARIHDRWRNVYRSDPRTERLNDRKYARIMGRIKPSESLRVLDAGCGSGEHARRFARMGHSCVGVDLSAGVLDAAKAAAERDGLSPSRVDFRQAAMEALSFEDASFDLVHCRGVLMHIPAWQTALSELVRVLKSGGHVVLFENNQTALEHALIRALRLVRTGDSRLMRTPSGDEFHTTADGEAPLTRILSQRVLTRELGRLGVRLLSRFAGDFWDLNRFSSGWPRRLASAWNAAWFGLGLPWLPCSGTITIGVKSG
ncbi:MAG: class I SAM-dependent methyltransferase, partial [Gemmataceae bacterium]